MNTCTRPSIGSSPESGNQGISPAHRFFITFHNLQFFCVVQFLGAFAKLHKRLLSSSCPSVFPHVCLSVRSSVYPHVCLSVRSSVYPRVCLFAWNNSALTARIFMKFAIWWYLENVSRKFTFYKNMTVIMKTLHEDHYNFLSLSLSSS